MSTHEDFRRESGAETGSDRSFGIVFVFVFLIIGLVPLFSDAPVRTWALGVAGVILAISFSRPSLLSPFNRLWGRLGLLLSKIVNPLVLGMMYFCVITPIGLVMRVAGKDLLKLKFDRSCRTYWIEREPPGPPPESMKNQF